MRSNRQRRDSAEYCLENTPHLIRMSIADRISDNDFVSSELCQPRCDFDNTLFRDDALNSTAKGRSDSACEPRPSCSTGIAQRYDVREIFNRLVRGPAHIC